MYILNLFLVLGVKQVPSRTQIVGIQPNATKGVNSNLAQHNSLGELLLIQNNKGAASGTVSRPRTNTITGLSSGNNTMTPNMLKQ